MDDATMNRPNENSKSFDPFHYFDEDLSSNTSCTGGFGSAVGLSPAKLEAFILGDAPSTTAQAGPTSRGDPDPSGKTVEGRLELQSGRPMVLAIRLLDEYERHVASE
jgi:hypothetical protein